MLAFKVRTVDRAGESIRDFISQLTARANSAIAGERNGDSSFQLGCAVPAWRTDKAGYTTSSTSATSPTADEAIGTIAPGGTASGVIDTSGDVDYFNITLVAGQSYMISMVGSGGAPLADAYLSLTSLGVVVASDDDGGQSTNSLLTFTATAGGTYQIVAEAYPGAGLTGGYTIDVRQMGSDSVGSTIGAATPITVGMTTFGFLETGTDTDMYAVTLVAGEYYTFDLAGGADYNTNYQAVPAGELDTLLTLFDSAGNQVAFNDDINYPDDLSSGVSFSPTVSGTYYIKVDAYPRQTGGYTLNITQVDLTNLDPLDTIDWGTQLASNTVTVYFAGVGETFDGVTSLGWSQYEIDQAMAAFQTYADVANLTFTITTNSSAATFKLVTTTSTDYLGYFNPPGTTNAGVGVFAVNGDGWNTTGGLAAGGYGFITLVHEFGHGLGLSHPHDNGGTSSIMPGVTSPFNSYGVFDLNQGVYTTMSYNDGWQLHPSGSSPGSLNYGYQAGPSALDIALIQLKYGAASNNTGDNVYVLPTANAAGTFWDVIWDSGGTDTIAHNGTVSATIDLTAATLDYSATGGGVISYVDGIFGGFTIAAGVVIENATGGSGADVIIGNSANNRLDGRAGNDTILGGLGNDMIFAGVGTDALNGGEGDDGIYLGAALTTGDTIDGGAGQDQLGLQGNYAATFGSAQLVNIETLVLLSSQDNRFGGAIPSSLFSYNLTTVDANVVAGQILTVTWNQLTAGENVTFNGSAETSGGFLTYAGLGNDTIIGGGGADGFFFGGNGRFSAADTINGGAGSDQVGLRGDYSSQIVFSGSTIQNIEALILLSATNTRFEGGGTSFSYNLKSHDANVAAGQTLTVEGSRLTATETVIFDGSSETDGQFRLWGGAGTDQLHGGAQADEVYGGLNADVLAGGGGGDTFLYRSTNDSTTTAMDTIVDFTDIDVIDVTFIDADVSAAGNQAFTFVTGGFTGAAGQIYSQYDSVTNKTYVYGDVNGDGVADMTISLSGNVSLGGADFLL